MTEQKGDQQDDIGLLLKKIHDGIGREANNALRPMDLTLSQLRVMTFLSCRGNQPTTQKEIEQRFAVSHPTVVGIIQRLAGKNLIECNVNRNDHRVKDIRLTEDGLRFAQHMKDHRSNMETMLIAGFTEEEVQTLHRLLSQIVQNINQVCGETADCREGRNHGR